MYYCIMQNNVYMCSLYKTNIKKINSFILSLKAVI